jgi:hypothetical protein
MPLEQRLEELSADVSQRIDVLRERMRELNAQLRPIAKRSGIAFSSVEWCNSAGRRGKWGWEDAHEYTYHLHIGKHEAKNARRWGLYFQRRPWGELAGASYFLAETAKRGLLVWAADHMTDFLGAYTEAVAACAEAVARAECGLRLAAREHLPDDVS